MSLSVDYCYQFVLKLSRSNQSGRLSGAMFTKFWNDQSRAYQSELLGPFQARNTGKTGINTGLIEDETILQKLSPFTTPASISISSGKSDKPNNFQFRLALRINGADCWKINHNQIATVNNDVIDPPSIADNRFYFVEYLGYYYFLPTTLPTASILTSNLDYIATPTDIVWAFTYDAAGRQVYSPSGLTGLDVIYGGVGYTTPTIAFSAPAAGGVQATGTLTVVGGVITKVVITNVGTGYAGLTPTFTITGSSTTPASFGSPIVSVQPQWDNLSCSEITKRVLADMGVSLKDKDFENFGQRVIATGS